MCKKIKAQIELGLINYLKKYVISFIYYINGFHRFTDFDIN